MALGRLLLRTTTLNKSVGLGSVAAVLTVEPAPRQITAVSRNAFTATKPDPFKPNMLRVGLAFGTTAFLWAMLFKTHWSDVQEYKARNGLE